LAPRGVLAIVLAGELLALVLALASLPEPGFWERFAGTSLFVQWVGLGTAALLGLGRRPLSRRTPVTRLTVALGALLLVTAATTLAAVWILDPAGLAALRGPHAWGLATRNLALAGILGASALGYLYLRPRPPQGPPPEAPPVTRPTPAQVGRYPVPLRFPARGEPA
jgi:two-component system sensor histidine kinase AlgZ